MEPQLFGYIGWRRTTGGLKGIHQEPGKAVLKGRGLYPTNFGQSTQLSTLKVKEFEVL